MENLADQFPAATPDDAGRAELGRWVRSFCQTYAAHAIAGRVGPAGGDVQSTTATAQLDALACLLMLERVNYLVSADVEILEDEVADRLTAIIFVVFHAGCSGQVKPARRQRATTAGVTQQCARGAPCAPRSR
jgi:hypothetical protein